MEHVQRFVDLVNRPVFERFVKFSVVGISGVIVNFGILWWLTEIGGWYYLHSSLVAIELSILSNFALNDYWTFSDHHPKGRRLIHRAMLFNATYILGLVINVSTLWVLTEYANLYYLIANVGGIVLATFWNFAFSEKFVW